jgi:hypothetical protein
VKRDYLLWAALLAVLVVLASAEYRLAVACGFGPWVAAGLPASLDVYALAALRARRDVLTVVSVLIGVNAASHLVEVGLLPVSWQLVVAVSAVAPLVLWRVHRLSDDHTPTAPPAEYAAAVERVPVPAPAPPAPEAYPALPEPVPAVPEAVPAGVQLLPIVARPEPVAADATFAAEPPRTRTQVHAEYTPETPEDAVPDAEPDPLTAFGLGDTAQQFRDELLAGEVPSIRSIKDRVRCGQSRAEALQNAFRAFVEQRQEVRA